jgi:phage baseplate assembly protein W
MAFNPLTIPATDFYPNIGVGVNIPFSAASVFQSTYTSKEAIKNNLINWFLTEKGERLDNPEFGGGLRSFLFEQISNKTLIDLEDEIIARISNYFPSINLEGLSIIPDPDSNIIRVTIKYSIRSQGLEDEIIINF